MPGYPHTASLMPTSLTLAYVCSHFQTCSPHQGSVLLLLGCCWFWSLMQNSPGSPLHSRILPITPDHPGVVDSFVRLLEKATELEDKLFPFTRENFSQPLYCHVPWMCGRGRNTPLTAEAPANRLGPHLLPNLATLWDLAAPAPTNPVESKAGCHSPAG